MDNLSKIDRSRLMSKIANKDNRLEISVRKFLFANGFRYRKNVRSLPGSPDIVLPRYRTVIFVHGCFWHGHEDCDRARLPVTRGEFWRQKIEVNKERDRRAESQLIEMGWKILKVWRCEQTSKVLRDKRFARLIKQIKTNSIPDS